MADVIARFLNFLVTNGSTQMSRVNIAGHSLGAHIAGLTGKRVTEGRIHVIFGMDPGGPLFSVNSPNERLDFDDADYTEGLRTNAGLLGLAEPICHADFYPNWGGTQPGCGIDISGSCSHSRAHEFFAETITSDRFVAQRCNSYQEIVDRSCTGQGTAIMGGEPGNVGTRGIFFLQTNGSPPFAMG